MFDGLFVSSCQSECFSHSESRVTLVSVVSTKRSKFHLCSN